jgi:hypothetical protein
MSTCHFDPVVVRQVPLIKKIIADETWLEGERRRCAVSPNDPVVREKVCQVVLRIGAEMRESINRSLGHPSDNRTAPPSDHRVTGHS